MKMTACLSRGFAFVPLLYLIGLFVVFGGIGVAVTSHLKKQSNSEPVEIGNSDVIQEQQSDLQNETGTSSSTNSESSEDTGTAHVYDGSDSSPRDVSTGDITSILPNRTLPIKVESTTSNVPVVPIIENGEVNSQLSITYNQVKIESDYLSEALAFLRDRLKEVESFQSQGLAICSASYKDDTSQAKYDAESLKQSYSESRTGFATQPSVLQDIDKALQSDLQQIESEYEYCKSKYAVDSSIERDINAISSSQSSVIKKLTFGFTSVLPKHKKTIFLMIEKS